MSAIRRRIWTRKSTDVLGSQFWSKFLYFYFLVKSFMLKIPQKGHRWNTTGREISQRIQRPHRTFSVIKGWDELEVCIMKTEMSTRCVFTFVTPAVKHISKCTRIKGDSRTFNAHSHRHSELRKLLRHKFWDENASDIFHNRHFCCAQPRLWRAIGGGSIRNIQKHRNVQLYPN